MSDDKTQRGSPDSKRLNKGEAYEVAYAKARKTTSRGASAKRAAPAAKRVAKKSASPRAAPAVASRRAGPKPSSRGAPHPPSAEKTTENTAPRTLKAADAVDLLTDDHLAVSTLFRRYEKLAKKKAPAGQREELARTICTMLTTHTAIEEELLYPAARRAGIDPMLLDEADIEHASAKDLIARIERGRGDDDHYDAKVKVLGEYITHHVVEEHTELFPKCRRSRLDLVALRSRMEARKAALDARSQPLAAEGVPMTASAESAGILGLISQTLFSGKKP